MNLDEHLTELRATLRDRVHSRSVAERLDRGFTVADAFNYGLYYDKISTGALIDDVVLRAGACPEPLASVTVTVEGVDADEDMRERRVIVTRAADKGVTDQEPVLAATFYANPDRLRGWEGLELIADRVHQAIRMVAALPPAAAGR